MHRRVDLTFSHDFLYYELIDIWPFFFHFGPSVLRVFLTKFPLSPLTKSPLHWLGVSSYPLPSSAKAHVSWLMS